MEQDLLHPDPKGAAAPHEQLGKYIVKTAEGWSSDDEPVSPVLTDNLCTHCEGTAVWSCRTCDEKYCRDCWSACHENVADMTKHNKRTFKYREYGVEGPVQLSESRSGAEVLSGSARDCDADTADALLYQFITKK
eukprot:TRINITY_DN44066_c0_g1_i1.p1 TRINITY_DN44066_c0_g1~~TRINITY_DN44066_c0_g1_i1.p1  ORF type:complete len:135 (+),score=10.00 TRINITY_DN44066_c0_g1_i1:47-451(+)